MTHIDRALGFFEQGLNMAGYVPFVRGWSGALRMVYGKTEVVCSLGMAAITALAALFNSNAREKQLGLDHAVEIVKTYVLHGVTNVARGAIEAFSIPLPILNLIPVTWFTCLPYDYSGNRFSYPQEGAPQLGIQAYRLRHPQRG